MFRNRLQILRLRLLETQWYWQLKRFWENLRFGLELRAVNFRAGISAHTSTIAAVWRLIRTSSSSTVPGAIFAIILALATKLPFGVEPETFVNILDEIKPESAAAYDSLLAVVLTAAGLFLTLYFSNFNTVIGRLYSEYPENVRRLLIDEPQNRAALLALTNFVVFTLVTLGCGAGLGIRAKSSLLAVVAGGTAIVPIFAFVARRTLFFFDPTHLAHTAIDSLAAASSEVTADRPLAFDARVQRHRANVAAAELDKLHALTRIAADKRNFRRDSLCALLTVVFSFLPEYQRRKRSIPTSSNWYRETVQHKDWYLAGITDLQVALNSAIGLMPDSVRDSDWLEKSLVGLLEQCFERTVLEQDWPVAYRILDISRLLFERLGAGCQLGIVTESFRSLRTSMEQHGFRSDKELSKEDQLDRLQAIAELNMLAKHILLSFFNELRALDPSSYMHRVRSLDWQTEDDVYSGDMPPFTLAQMEYLRDRLRFEIDVEGEIVSPEWYLSQLALQPIAEMLDTQLKELIGLGKSFYVDWPDKLTNAGLYRGAIMTTLDGLEYFHKLRFHASAIYERMEIVEQNRVMEALAGPKIEQNAVNAEIHALERQLHLNLAKLVQYFATDTYEEWDEVPDQLGHVVTALANAYFEGLMSNDVELCGDLFGRYIVGNVCVRESLGTKSSALQYPGDLVSVAEPTLELLALSGFTYLLSEYHQEPALWQSCVDFWRRLIGAPEFQGNFAAEIQLTDAAKRVHLLSGRSMLRNSWKQNFDTLIADLPSKLLDRGAAPIWIETEVTLHPSLCIRALTGGDLPFGVALFDPEDVFLDVFLADELELDRSNALRMSDVKELVRHQAEFEAQHGFVFELDEDIIDEN